MNPTLNPYQSLLINSNTCEANLHFLVDASEEYMLEKEVAQRIIDEVTETMRRWRQLANKLGIPSREVLSFATRFDRAF